MSQLLDHGSLGRYENLELIGEGAMAHVYKAHDPAIDRNVALKVLKPVHCVDEDYRSRFVREARAAGALSHPNIVTIFDVDEQDGTPYISMELLEAVPLDERMVNGPKLEVDEVVSIGIQLADALDYAHERGVVHRDIKPSNILFANGVVKLADFGIARVETQDDVNRTQVGTVLGTPRYMAPEQAHGREVDARTDLFAVGVVLYELLSGSPAFDGATSTSLVLQITQTDTVPIRKRVPGLPAGLGKIVDRLLKKKPEHRFQSGAELASALCREQRALEEQARETRRNKYVPIKYQWGAAIGVLVGLVLAVTTYTTYTAQVAEIRRIAIDSGQSLARYVATQAAIQTLSEDWISLETFVEEAGNRNTFEYLIIADRHGIARAATNPEDIGKPISVADNGVQVASTSDVQVREFVTHDGVQVFNFSARITYQNIDIGSIELGLSQRSLQAVTDANRLSLMTLAGITLACVMGVLFVFGSLLARPTRMLLDAFADMGAGDVDRRISVVRTDEFGELFDGFNDMAEQVSQRAQRERAARELLGGAVAEPEAPIGQVTDIALVAARAGSARSPDETVIAPANPV